MTDREQGRAVAWIVTGPRGQEMHISAHDGWEVREIMRDPYAPSISAERVRKIAEGVGLAMLIKGGQRSALNGLVEAAIERALSEAGVRVEGE